MRIIPQHKFFQRRRREIRLRTPVFEALPAYANRCVDADHEEEGAFDEGVDDLIVPEIGCNPAFAPSEGYEVE